LSQLVHLFLLLPEESISGDLGRPRRLNGTAFLSLEEKALLREKSKEGAGFEPLGALLCSGHFVFFRSIS
jgi:hypothetical protein